ncbi:WXG100-like domain-containing protein [Nocardia sp. NPDC003963]
MASLLSVDGHVEVSGLVALPEGFPLAVCEPVLGPFPRGNPEALRAGGDAWERAARRCRSEAAELAGVASSVPGCLSGDTAVEAQRVVAGSAARKHDLAGYCESKAVECRETANAVELGRFTWIVMGSAMVVELLASLVMPVGGVAAAAAARAAARRGWQLAWGQLIESVVALCARLSASRAALIGQGIVAGAVFGGGVTWGGQVWQLRRGDRETIDWAAVTVSGAGGAAGGVGAGVLYTRPVAGVLARLQASGTRGANAVAMLVAGGAAGVAGGVTGTLGGAVAASTYSGDPVLPDGSEFYLGAISGALEGLLSGGVHTIGHSATPPRPPAGLLGGPAGPPKPNDLAEIFTRAIHGRTSGPSGRADLPRLAATDAAPPSARPGDMPPTARANPVEAGAESVVGTAGTSTGPGAPPADHLTPSDRSATAPGPGRSTPDVTAAAGPTARSGVDAQPGPTTYAAPAGRSDIVTRYSTRPAADADDTFATTAAPTSESRATADPPAAVTETHTTGNVVATDIPAGADGAVNAAGPRNSTVPAASDPPVETPATSLLAGAHNRPEPQPVVPGIHIAEHYTPPGHPNPEHTPSPWRSQRTPPPEPGSHASPVGTAADPRP